MGPKTRLTGDERRTCIVETACKLFAEKGFRGTTTRELAAAAGITEPVLYEHFKTKRDLYSAIIEAKARLGLETVQAIATEYANSDDDEGFFNALGVNIVDWYTSDPSVLRLLLFSNLEGHELKELFQERGKSCFFVVTAYIQRRMEQGAIRTLDPALVARAFFGMIAHYAMSALVFGFAPFPKPIEDVVSEMVDIFMTGLRAPQQQK